MKKTLFALLGIWIAIFIVSFITSSDLKFGLRILYTLVVAVIGSFGFYCITPNNRSKRSGSSRQAKMSPKNTKDIYIFKGMERKFSYRYDGKYVYEGMSQKFIYRVEKDKIYKGTDSKFAYRIEGNKIYQGMARQPLYRIDGKRIYSGDFGRQPVFRISNTISI